MNIRKGMWTDCGNGTLELPGSHAPVATSVVEKKDFGRIFEVYDYSDTPEQNQRLILAAPDLLEVVQSVVQWNMSNGIGRKKPEPLFPSIIEAARAALIKAGK